VTAFLYAAASSGEAPPPLKEFDHPCHRDSGGFGRLDVVRPNGAIGNQVRRHPEAVVGATFDTARLVPGRSLHPFAGGCVEREHRQRLFRRNAVPGFYVPERRWPCGWPCGSGFAAGAAVSGVPGVAAGWRVVGRVGNRSGVRAAVTV
jgi:hypothetical protein